MNSFFVYTKVHNLLFNESSSFTAIVQAGKSHFKLLISEYWKQLFMKLFKINQNSIDD